MTEKGNKPVETFRAGSVSASVWNNPREKDGKKFDNLSVSMQRGYKDKDGNWQNTGTLFAADIAKAQLVLARAYEYMVIRKDVEE